MRSEPTRFTWARWPKPRSSIRSSASQLCKKGGFDKHLIGYFLADSGMINQIIHMWKFADDADRRAFWARLYADKNFMDGFRVKFLKLPRFRGHPTFWVEGVHDVEAKVTLPT